MNILLLNHYAGSSEMGMEFRPYYFAREWIKMGHHVKIVGGDYSHLRNINPSVKQDFQKEDIDGIDYYWIKTGDYKGNGARRAFTMFRFVGKLWLNAGKIAREWRPDVVIASSTYPLDTYAAQRIAKKSGAKLIHEVHDMWPSTLYEIGGMSRNHPFVLLMQAAENSAYKNSQYIVSLLPLAKNYMVKHGMKADKFVTISNGVVEAEWKNSKPLSADYVDYLKIKKIENKFIVGYFGGHAMSNALGMLLDVAKKIEDPDIIFVLVGQGVEKIQLEKRKETEKINNVIFFPAIKKEEIPSLLTYFDCIYIGSQNSPLYRFGICLNKIFDSMMSGKPIVCAITTPTAPVSENNCGIMVHSGDIDGIITAIKKIKSMSERERNEMGERGKKAVQEKYLYEILAVEFTKLF